ncbi:MAG: hypothetical protein AABW80_03460 [Nanoarchaeota archaeon]
MEFVAFVGEDKENWGQVTALLNRLEYERAIIIKSSKEDFPTNGKCKVINISSEKSLIDMKEQMQEKLKKELSGDFEVSLSLASGNGKEHMALLSALLNTPVGVKIVVFTKEGIKWLS